MWRSMYGKSQQWPSQGVESSKWCSNWALLKLPAKKRTPLPCPRIMGAPPQVLDWD